MKRFLIIGATALFPAAGAAQRANQSAGAWLLAHHDGTPEGIMPVPGAGGTSPRHADAAVRAQEASYVGGWYGSITGEIWHS